MFPVTRLTLALTLGAGMLLAAAPARAQSGGEEAAEQVEAPPVRVYSDRLLVNFAGGGGWDANVLARGEGTFGTLTPFVRRASSFGDLAGDLAYFGRYRALELDATAGSAVRSYPRAVADYIVTHRASSDARIRVGRRTRLMVGGLAFVQPYFPLGTFESPGQAEATAAAFPVLDASNVQQRGLVLAGRVELVKEFSRRNSISGGYRYRSSDFPGNALDVRWHTARAQVRHPFSRNAALRLGYGYEAGQYGVSGGERVQIHHLDTGLDYSRALSHSHRTTVDVTTGAALFRDRRGRFVRLTGRARLVYKMGRTWSADAAYQREVGFVDVLPEPTTADTVATSLSGMVGRTVSVRVAASYSTGFVGITAAQDRAYDVYRATAAVSIPLGHHVVVSAEPFFYHYSFASSVFLPAGWSRRVNRPGARVQLATWLPIFERARRPDADR